MKKCLFLICLIILTVILTSCGNNPSSTKISSHKFTIVTSFYPMYIFTKNITKDIKDVEVVNLTRETTGCLHDYQMTPSDIKILENADLFIINGASMESFMDKVTSQLPNLKILDTSKGIKLIKNKSLGEDNLTYNPHTFVSISNAIKQVATIADNLTLLDSKHKSEYLNNKQVYLSKLNSLKTKMHTELDKYKGRKIITFHEAFPYFAEEFGLEIAAVIEREPGSEPSAKELAHTIDIVKSSNIHALFAEPQYPAQASTIISDESGAKVYILDPIVTGDINNIDIYTEKMDENLKILKEALSNE